MTNILKDAKAMRFEIAVRTLERIIIAVIKEENYTLSSQLMDVLATAQAKEPNAEAVVTYITDKQLPFTLAENKDIMYDTLSMFEKLI